MFYKVIFEPAEEGGYTVYVPALKGCISEGDTYEEALRNIKDAIQLYVDTLKDRGREIPEDSHHIAEVECLV
ncbi:MAG TPA: type II toxin-antitoxin system HicB family antitoxin [Dehalococcoidia bacterium]|nr:type II toxin-antitoxin system HicB family antitoxin [Dehalococcoidia bacterium]